MDAPLAGEFAVAFDVLGVPVQVPLGDLTGERSSSRTTPSGSVAVTGGSIPDGGPAAERSSRDDHVGVAMIEALPVHGLQHRDRQFNPACLMRASTASLASETP